MNLSLLVVIIFPVFFGIQGISMIVAGKPLIGSTSPYYSKFTEESVKNYMKPGGAAYILLGIGVGLLDLGMMNDDLLKLESAVPIYVAGGIVLAASIVIIVLAMKKLVKKGSKKDEETFVDED